MDVTDYNGVGRWSRTAIQQRYTQYAAESTSAIRDLSPLEYSERGRHWVYPVMQCVIDGIEAGDPACVRIGIEFIEDDGKFPFGKVLKANTARALRRAQLSDPQKQRVRRRVFSLLRAGHIPHEFREYAKLARKVGFTAAEVPVGTSPNPHVERFRSYFAAAAVRPGT
jgi:hypothetical protein